MKIKIYKWGKKNSKKLFVQGKTDRPRTAIDDAIDETILEKYYKESKEKRSPKKDKEILDKSYFREKTK